MGSNTRGSSSSAAKQTRLQILEWNCNSQQRCHAELYELAKQHNYDIIFLQETYTLPKECRLPGCLLPQCYQLSRAALPARVFQQHRTHPQPCESGSLHQKHHPARSGRSLRPPERTPRMRGRHHLHGGRGDDDGECLHETQLGPCRAVLLNCSESA